MNIRKTKALWFSGLTAAIFVSVAMFQWIIIDWITPFLFPLLEKSLLCLFLVSVISSLFKLIKDYKREKVHSTFPLWINLITAAVIWFVPFTNLWLQFDFNYHKEDRTTVVENVNNKTLLPNVEHNKALIQLSHEYPTLSRGGNEIVIWPADQSYFVFFFTYRGFLDNYSGFVYAPPGSKPELFGEWRGDNFFQIKQMAPNWYFVASR
jgi:hypothetical protein